MRSAIPILTVGFPFFNIGKGLFGDTNAQRCLPNRKTFSGAPCSNEMAKCLGVGNVPTGGHAGFVTVLIKPSKLALIVGF